VRTTLVTWNLKGSAGPDLDGVIDHLRAEGADVVALQEVQWHQARRIARALGARSRGWSFKHWPVRTWPEGMAVIGVTRSLRVRTRALSHPWRLWSWRRRIVQLASIEAPGGGDGDGGDSGGDGGERLVAVNGRGSDGRSGGGLTLVNVHLTPHGEATLREVETAAVLALVAGQPGPAVLCGDLNERPAGPVHRRLVEAGMRDAHEDAAGPHPFPAAPGRAGDPWPTNWPGWERGTTAAPTRRLDYVYLSPGVGVVAVTVPAVGDPGFERFSHLSDHLPVTAVLADDER
jgi:endonuclease/exonuclease/phosphatase family metal-dependent hydrolase